MGQLFIKWFSAVLLMVSVSAQAQESESRIKTDDVKEIKNKNKTPGQDVDELITNNLLRAQTGSKSRWSLSSNLDYSGGSIQKPLAEDRPNIASTTGDTPKASINGTISGKYNISAVNSLSAGVGVRWIAPLSTGSPKNYNGDRVDAVNPMLTFQHLYKWSGIQSVLAVEPIYYTESNLVKQGYEYLLYVSQDNVLEIGHSGLSLGVSVSGQFGTFNKTGPLGSKNDQDNYIDDLRTVQADYVFGLSPILEFAFNDTYNFRTVTNIWNFEHMRSFSSPNKYVNDTITQSVGLGISVTRDVFIYPNVQFLPENIRSDRTNVAVNTNINLF